MAISSIPGVQKRAIDNWDIDDLQSLVCWTYFRKHENIFSFSVISQHWDNAAFWNTSLWKKWVHMPSTVNNIVANVLGPDSI